jgi:two-component system response regulator
MQSPIIEPYFVLLLEDNADDEQLALRAFRSCHLPLSVQVARDGARGLELLGLTGSNPIQNIPDLIVSDLKMPRYGGDEVLRRVRADQNLRRIPFVIFSSSDEANDIQRCYEFGATAYCVKPVGFHDYVECAKGIVHRWLPAGDEKDVPACARNMAKGTLI